MRRGQRLVGLLWRWHRRTGVAICVFVGLLAATGVALNHTSGLGLDKRFVGWDWLNAVYGDDSRQLRAYPLAGRWLSRAGGGPLYLDAAKVAECRGDLVGVAQAGGMLLAACAEELVLLTPAGDLVETLGTGSGLRTPLTGLGLAESEIALRSGEEWVLADLDRLDFSRSPPAGALIRQVAPGELPASIRERIPAPQQWLTWERVLLDLHSGRLFGGAGVWLVDAVGVLLICIAGSGVTMWWYHRRRTQSR